MEGTTEGAACVRAVHCETAAHRRFACAVVYVCGPMQGSAWLGLGSSGVP